MKLIEQLHITENKLEIIPHASLKGTYLKENFFLTVEKINLKEIPLNILLTPFIFNIAPIIWLSGKEFTLDTLNEYTHESLRNLKEIFVSLYPSISFQGSIKPETVLKDTTTVANTQYKKSIALFSGGLDSITTVYRQYDNLKALVVIRGADIKLTDDDGWKKVTENTDEFARTHNLTPYFITSNLRDFLNNAYLDSICHGAGWWAQIQHGLGLTSLMSIPAFFEKANTCFIASSHTQAFSHYAWASMPKIDNNVQWSEAAVIHDGYELTRQGKTQFLINAVKNIKSAPPNLRVCYLTEGGTNCCQCEKCSRTITALIACNADPREYGFNIEINEFVRLTKNKFNKIKFAFKENEIFHWNDISQHIQIETIDKNKRIEIEYLNWIKNYNFKEYGTYYQVKRLKKEQNIFRKLKYKIKSLLAS